MPAQSFHTLDVLRLEVEADPVGLVNLIQNASGEFGGWGWVTPIPGSTLRRMSTGVLGYTSTATSAIGQFWYSEPFLIAAAQYAAAVLDVTAKPPNAAYRIRFDWLDTTKTQIGQSAWVNFSTTGAGKSVPASQAPAGTVYARLRIERSSSTGVYPFTNGFGGQFNYHNVMVAKAATSAALAGLTYQPVPYTNILGPTHDITIQRDELEISLLTATVLDASLDPATAGLLRPGRRCRVTTLTPAGEWESLFLGKVRNAKVTYDYARTDAKRARIALTAVDRGAQLAATPVEEGVAAIGSLPYILEGHGIPWNVNGSGNHLTTTPAIVARNPNASLLDQIAITRDSVQGYAWVDRVGVLQAWDAASLSTAIAAALDESDYSALLVDYDTERCINTANLKYLRINLATGETVEVPYGPYVDQDSVDEWDVHSADFTIQGITETESNMAAYAAAVFDANGTPTVRVNEVALPIATPGDVTKALLDLYDLVTVTNTDNALDVDMRVTGVEHVIATDKWLTHLKFANDGGVAPPQPTPSPPVPTGDNTNTWVAESTAEQTFTTAAMIDVTGCTVTIPVGSPADKFLVIGTLDANGAGAGIALAVANLVVGGVAQDGQMIADVPSASSRKTVGQQWIVTGLAAGDRVFKLQACNINNSSTVMVAARHTRFTVVRLP